MAEPTLLAGALPTGEQDDDSEEIELGLDGKPRPPRMAMNPEPGAPESINLADKLTSSERKAIGKKVCEQFDSDVEAGELHMQRLKRWDDLYASVQKAKTWPFDRAANVNVPIELYTVLQIQGRLFDMIIPSKGDIFHSLATDSLPEELDRANRTELHMNYWARHETPEFVHVYDDLLFQFTLYGSTFSCYMYDEDEERIVPECISAADFVVHPDAKATSPQLRGVPVYTRIRRTNWNEIQDKGRQGFYIDTDDIKPTADPVKDEGPLREGARKMDGLEKGDKDDAEDEERQVLEQYIRWLKLPNDPKRDPSFDGLPHAVIAWVDAETETLLRLVVREEVPPRKQKEFDQANQAFMSYQQAAMQHQASGGAMPGPDGQLHQVPPPPPVPEPKQPKKREITFFTHWRAFPTRGFYGLGFGDIVGPLNEAMNTMINQTIDRGTVNNARGGFISRQLRFQRGPIAMQPGQWNEIDAPPAAIKDGIFIPPAVPGDPEMFKIATMVESWAQRASGSGDTLSGEPIGANETARAAVLRHQAAEKQITILGSRAISYMKNDVDMLWRLFSIFLPDQPTQTQTMTKEGQPAQQNISRQDFIPDAKVFPAADPRVTSKDERIAEADNAMAKAMQNPMLAQNPMVIRRLTEKQLHASGDTDIIALLPPPQPPEPPPMDQHDENALFLQGQNPQVNPKDNHDEHLHKISMFKQSPEAQAMTPQQSQALDQHARNHIAGKIHQEAANARQPTHPPTALTVPGPNGAGPPGVAGPPGQQATA